MSPDLCLISYRDWWLLIIPEFWYFPVSPVTVSLSFTILSLPIVSNSFPDCLHVSANCSMFPFPLPVPELWCFAKVYTNNRSYWYFLCLGSLFLWSWSVCEFYSLLFLIFAKTFEVSCFLLRSKLRRWTHSASLRFGIISLGLLFGYISGKTTDF